MQTYVAFMMLCILTAFDELLSICFWFCYFRRKDFGVILGMEKDDTCKVSNLVNVLYFLRIGDLCPLYSLDSERGPGRT